MRSIYPFVARSIVHEWLIRYLGRSLLSMMFLLMERWRERQGPGVPVCRFRRHFSFF